MRPAAQPRPILESEASQDHPEVRPIDADDREAGIEQSGPSEGIVPAKFDRVADRWIGRFLHSRFLYSVILTDCVADRSAARRF